MFEVLILGQGHRNVTLIWAAGTGRDRMGDGGWGGGLERRTEEPGDDLGGIPNS